jgi:hypothetical protein
MQQNLILHALERHAAILMPANAKGVDVVLIVHDEAAGACGAILPQS